MILVVVILAIMGTLLCAFRIALSLSARISDHQMTFYSLLRQHEQLVHDIQWREGTYWLIAEFSLAFIASLSICMMTMQTGALLLIIMSALSTLALGIKVYRLILLFFGGR